ncbi:MAG: carboxypeptidase regulatory-like domain-containing protein [Myxococcales bacterium]|nr:carboxypeptidase regulatory-like domain-containing protein [Myxococcales bacterium]
MDLRRVAGDRTLPDRAAGASGLAGTSVALLITMVAGACGPGARRDVEGVVREARTGRPIAGARVQAEDGTSVPTDAQGRFRIALPVGAQRTIRASAAEHCPTEHGLDVSEREMAPVTIHLFPRIELDGDHQVQVGFGASVRVAVRLRCDPGATVRWRQTSGPALEETRLRIEEGGRVLHVRTHDLETLARTRERPGVLAFARAERGDYRFEAQIDLDGTVVRRVARVVAAPASTGVFQVPTGADVYLEGGVADAPHRWTLLEKPRDSRAELRDADRRHARLRPDRFGAYRLRHEPSGVEMLLMAGAHDEVPRDCGREGCHAPEGDGWETTAHAATFRRGLAGELGAEFSERCWACHATGVEPGVPNGGLHETAAEARWTQPAPGPQVWEEAPRTIRRHGSVWCSACHGPGRILPPAFHWQYAAKFSSALCARCHDVVDDPDANHASWQVREHRASPMSRLIRGGRPDDPATRSGCASCHSAQGFIAALEGRAVVPPGGEAHAIECASCHDPHDGTRPHALRVHDTVPDVAGRSVRGLGTGAVCVACHRTSPGTDPATSAPHAPQAEVMLGTGSRLLRRAVPGPHTSLADACVACHMARPPEGDPLRGRAGGHTFSARDLSSTGIAPSLAPFACSGCHGSAVPPHAIGGIRDHDGDGTEADFGRDVAHALRVTGEALRARVRAARAVDTCPDRRVAAGWTDHDARLLLVDEAGRLLGDCDGDGLFGPTERPVGIDAVSDRLADVVHDHALLERDGSNGLHNPLFALRLLEAIRARLRDLEPRGASSR